MHIIHRLQLHSIHNLAAQCLNRAHKFCGSPLAQLTCVPITFWSRLPVASRLFNRNVCSTDSRTPHSHLDRWVLRHDALWTRQRPSSSTFVKLLVFPLLRAPIPLLLHRLVALYSPFVSFSPTSCVRLILGTLDCGISNSLSPKSREPWAPSWSLEFIVTRKFAATRALPS